MDARTQVASLHGMSMLHAAQRSFEENAVLALVHEPGDENDRALVCVAIASEIQLQGDPALAAAQAAREALAPPNCALSAAASLIGPRRQHAARIAMAKLIDLFAAAGVKDARDESLDVRGLDRSCAQLFAAPASDAKAEAMRAALKARGAKSAFVRYLDSLDVPLSADAMLAAIACTLAWGPLARKRISRVTAESIPWWVRLFGALIGASTDASAHRGDSFCGIAMRDLLERRSLGEVAFVALLGFEPRREDLFAFETLVGLLLTNGPGAISAQGAKGAVSADGPDVPQRVQLNKGLVGFLSHSGYTHGGNGYEGIAFLIERFAGTGLVDPSDPAHGIDLAALARSFAEDYARDKTNRKSAGAETRPIPGVNHPVFRDKPVNVDPREAFIHALFAKRGEYNAFHEFYRVLVQALFDAGVTRNVYCANIDAVIAALLLKMLWKPFKSGRCSAEAMESAAFTMFLYPRMLGCAAEIDDHMNRGRGMDTRTPASQCRFIA